VYSSVCYNYSGLCCILDRELGFTVLRSHDINCQLCFMLTGYKCLMQCPGLKSSRRPPHSGIGLTIGSDALMNSQHCKEAVKLHQRYTLASGNAAKLFMMQCSPDAYLACKPAYTS